MHPLYSDIPELARLESGQGLIRIPDEQDVPFTPRVRALVDTVEFRRLSQISQLGLVSRIYPGAMHTRFEHALGVFHNALAYLWQLGKDRRFRALIDVHSAEVLLVSSLLHDLGHWPYCHPIEDLALPDLAPHETFAAEFLEPGRELAQVLHDEWRIDAQEVLDVLAPGRPAHSPPLQGGAGGVALQVRETASGRWRSLQGGAGGCAPQDFEHRLPSAPFAPPVPSPETKGSAIADSPRLRLLRSILSGPIDIDKMDYLARDSLHCGVPYGRNFDKSRLIQSLLLNAAGDGLAISYKGKTAAELMVFARYVMFSEVYWHHAVRAATCMFARAFYELRRKVDLHELFQQTEADFIRTLRNAARATDAEPLLEGLFGGRRQIYKRVIEATLHQHADLYDLLARRPIDFLVRCSARLAELLSPRVGESVSPSDLVIDAPPGDREVEFEVDLYFPRQHEYRPLHEVSPVVRALAGTQFDDYVKRVRIFGRPRVARALRALDDLPAIVRQAVAQTEVQP